MMMKATMLAAVCGLAIAGTATACGNGRQIAAPETPAPAPTVEAIELTGAAGRGLGPMAMAATDGKAPAPASGTWTWTTTNRDGTVVVEAIDGEAPAAVFAVQAPRGLRHAWTRTSDEGSAVAGSAAEDDRRVRLGVVLEPVNAALAAQLGVDPERSILIQRVIERSPAAEAGLRDYDVLLRFDDSDGLSVERLRELLGRKSAGDTAEIVVLRGGEEQTVKVRFEGTEGTGNRVRVEAPQPPTAPAPSIRFFGRELDEESRARLQESLRRAEAQAERAQAQAKRLTLRLQKDLQPLGEMRGLKGLDAGAREKIEEAMAQLEETMREYDFDFDFDFDLEFEDLPRMRFIETDRDQPLRRGEGGGDGEGQRDQARVRGQDRERAVIIEKTERELHERRSPGRDRERGPRDRSGELERQVHERDRQIERLERRMERLESLLERVLERMDGEASDGRDAARR